MKTVAAALAIRPAMLLKWRKDVRYGLVRRRAPTDPLPVPARQISQLQALEPAYAELQEEHDLQNKKSGGVRRRDGEGIHYFQ